MMSKVVFLASFLAVNAATFLEPNHELENVPEAEPRDLLADFECPEGGCSGDRRMLTKKIRHDVDYKVPIVLPYDKDLDDMAEERAEELAEQAMMLLTRKPKKAKKAKFAGKKPIPKWLKEALAEEDDPCPEGGCGLLAKKNDVLKEETDTNMTAGLNDLEKLKKLKRISSAQYMIDRDSNRPQHPV